MSIKWTPKEWSQFLKKQDRPDNLTNKQLTRKVRILEKKVELHRAWMASIVAKLKKGAF